MGICLIFIDNSLLHELLNILYYIHLLIEMSLAINSKREQFRREIVKKQKQEFFMNKRRELMKSMQNYEQDEINPILIFKQRLEIRRAFEYLKLKFESSDYFAKIMKYVSQGLIGILFEFLKEGVQVAETFQIITIILQKKEEQIHFTSTFYEYGILQYAVKYLQSNFKCAAQCTYLLNIYTSKSGDYCESLLENEQHNVLMEYFMRRINNSQNAQHQNQNQGEGFYTYTLMTLQNLLKIQNSVLQYANQKLEIYNFILIVVQRRLFLKITLGILYQCVHDLQKNIVGPIITLVNKILGEVRPEDKCLHNLFAVIYIITHKYGPFELNFKEFYKVGIMSKKVQKPFIKIMDMYVKSVYAKQIPRNEEWWHQLLRSPQHNDLYCMMLKFIDKLQIKSEWIWRVYAAALAENIPIVQQEVIRILHFKVVKGQNAQMILTFLHKHRITTILENLSHKSKVEIIRSESNQLLEYILGTITERSSQMM